MAHRPLIAASLLLALPLLVLAGCQQENEAPAPLPDRGPAPIRLSADPWVLTTDAIDESYRGPYLGNGAIGGTFTSAGTSRSAGGWEPCYAAGLYEQESLVALPPLLPLEIRANGRVFGTDPIHFKTYQQELRLKEGVLFTRATWNTGAGEVEVEQQTAVLRDRPDTAIVQARLTNNATVDVAIGVPQGAWENARPTENGADGSIRWVGHGLSFWGRLGGDRTDLRRAQGMMPGYLLPPHQKAEFAFATRVQGLPVRLPEEATATEPTEPLEAHKKAWEELWKTDIQIDGDAEAQQIVRACLYQLFCSIRPENAFGVPPTGLSNRSFNGHMFWDMDTWVLPALLPQHPELAWAMLEYRFRTLPGAKANARAEKLPGASYAWESARTGKEALTGSEFVHGRHVTGDVALAARQYLAATGDREWLRTRGWPILQATADNWVARAKPDGQGGFVVKQVTTPDENAGRVDHSAWTHYVAQVNLRLAAETAKLLGKPANPRWETVADGLSFLRDPGGMILSHARFTERSKSKQADVLLLAHPGEAKIEPDELGRLYDFYAPRVIKNGPAMTDSIHAVVAARLGRGDEALARFRAGYQPFVRPPFHGFSEKRTRDNLCFVTGAAGVVQSVLYGFGGLHLQPDPEHPERPLLKPQLPPSWTRVRIGNLHWRGRRWDLELRPNAEPVWTPVQ